MIRRGWRPGSLRALLLLLLLPGVLASLIFDSYNDHQTLEEIINEAYDHALRAPLSALQNHVYVDAEETLHFHPPWYAQQPSHADAEEQIYYQVQLVPASPSAKDPGTSSQNYLLAGSPELSWPSPGLPLSEAPDFVFYNATIQGAPVRVAAHIEHIILGGEPHYLLLQVAQSQFSRLETESFAWHQEVKRDLRALIVVALLVWLGIRWGLKPLTQLRRDVDSRRAHDTTPLDVAAVPLEVVPLVEAVNHHIDRHRAMLEQQSQFLTDASHQLRTPLAVMLTQAEFAARETDLEQVHDSLRALIKRLTETRRMTDQLLSLAQAQHSTPDGKTDFDLAACGREVLISALDLAEQRQIDLGWDEAACTSESIWVYAHPEGIKQAIANLVHNALSHTPPGSTVTVAAGANTTQAWLSVSDNGPGIPEDQRTQATQRFWRLRRSHSGSGSGLGLAIARAFVERDNGSLELQNGLPHGQNHFGLKVVLILPLARIQSRTLS